MRLLVAVTTILLVAACSRASEFDRTFNNPDEYYMSDVARELDAAGVDFRVRRDGAIVYRSSDEHTFKAIENRLNERPLKQRAPNAIQK